MKSHFAVPAGACAAIAALLVIYILSPCSAHGTPGSKQHTAPPPSPAPHKTPPSSGKQQAPPSPATPGNAQPSTATQHKSKPSAPTHQDVLPPPSKILLVTVQLGSHVLEKVAIAEALVARGHEVYITVSTTYPKRAALERAGIKPLLFHMPDDEIVGGSEAVERILAEEVFVNRKNFLENGKRGSAMTLRDCTYMMKDASFLDQVRAIKFDLAITEPFVLCPCTLVLPEHLGIPFITLTSFYLPWEIRTPSLPSFVGLGPATLESKAESSLIARVINAIMFLGVHQIDWVMPGRVDSTLLQLYTPSVTSWSELIRRSQLFLVETDSRLGDHAPVMDNMVSVAGLTASPAKPLPTDLEAVVQGAGSNGIILVSFGSSAYYIPTHIITVFLAAFSQLKQTVIARLPTPEGVEVPSNVKLISWLPQNDLLGHPSIRLFITHCGNNGQYEALYHGVPMIGFPLFGEQKQNCIRAVNKGFGLRMDIMNFTADELVSSINEILRNPEYKATIKAVADMWHEDLTTPRQRAAHAVEHVIKYGGRHLRSPAMDMPLWEFLMLDVLAVLLGAILLLAWVVRRALAFVCRKCKSKSGQGKQPQKDDAKKRN